MKFIKVMLGIVVGLIVIVLVAFIIFLKTIDVNRFRSQITQQMSLALGREVKIDNLSFDFSLLKGIILNVQGLSIANENQDVYPFLVEIKRMRLDVDLMAFVRERKTFISNINIMAPKVMITREKSGELNVQKLVINMEAKTPKSKIDNDQAATLKQEQKAISNNFLSALLFKNIVIKDGRLIYIDKSLEPDLNLDIKKIDVIVSNFSFKDRFDFSVGLAIFNNYVQNVSISGHAQLDMPNQQVRLNDVQCVTDLEQVVVSNIKSVDFFSKAMSLFEDWRGLLRISISQLIAGQKGLAVLSGSGYV